MADTDFQTLYTKLFMPLGMYVLKITGDIDTSQDIVQDAFVETWARICRGESIANLKAYLYRTARNAAIAATSRLPEEIDTLADVPADDIDTSERDAALWRAIDTLPERCREVFLMSKRDGFSNADIAAELGISIKTVEAQITKAFTRLRDDARLRSHLPVFFLPFL